MLGSNCYWFFLRGNEYMKDFIFGLRSEDISEHRSYVHNLTSCEIIIKVWKKIGFERDSKRWPLWYIYICTYTVAVRNWAIKPTGSW